MARPKKQKPPIPSNFKIIGDINKKTGETWITVQGRGNDSHRRFGCDGNIHIPRYGRWHKRTTWAKNGYIFDDKDILWMHGTPTQPLTEETLMEIIFG
jgi:hypothetical protein